MRHILPLLAAATIVSLAACGTSSFPTAILRPAEGTPANFVNADGSAIVMRTSPSGVLCSSPIKDPVTGARLTMTRAMSGRADYTVPAGAYGVGVRELLRVDCTNGAPVGIVRG